MDQKIEDLLSLRDYGLPERTVHIPRKLRRLLMKHNPEFREYLQKYETPGLEIFK